MTEPDRESQTATTLLERRIAAVEDFVELADRLFEIGRVGWPEAMGSDLRPLALNAAFRRQLESIQAALLLAKQGLGHLAVGFVRGSLEEVMYLSFMFKLEREEAHRLLLVLAQWDGFRSLLAQRAYVGDTVMRDLWFTDELLESAGTARDAVRLELRALGKSYRWGGLLPSGEWVADQAGQRSLYEYLHSASSRSVHFSAGEVLRRAWGEPGGQITTNKPEFREHLADFALHQLVLLFSDLGSP